MSKKEYYILFKPTNKYKKTQARNLPFLSSFDVWPYVWSYKKSVVVINRRIASFNNIIYVFKSKNDAIKTCKLLNYIFTTLNLKNTNNHFSTETRFFTSSRVKSVKEDEVNYIDYNYAIKYFKCLNKKFRRFNKHYGCKVSLI